MTIKSLLLGSAAVLALGTSAQAADPIAVALDTCDLLNITGLTISSESNCLKFEGEVSYAWKYANYDLNTATVAPAIENTTSAVAWELTATATADSDFGPAFAVIGLEGSSSDNGLVTGTTTNVAAGDTIGFGDAYVGIGDAASTVIYAGKKGTIGNTDDGETLTAVFSVELSDALGGNVGGHVIQMQSSLGDGVTAGIGLEDLDTTNNATLVGTVAVSQDWGTAHATVAFDDVLLGGGNWDLHTGGSISADNLTFQAAFITNEASAWQAVLSASAEFDMFTVAAGLNLEPASNWDFAVSGVAAIDDNTTLTAGFTVNEASAWSARVEGEFGVSDTLTADAGVTFTSASTSTFDAGLTWAPGGGYEASVGVEAASSGNYSISTSFEKAFE